MRLLILHLSDLHFDVAAKNEAMLRASLVANASVGIIPGITHVVVVATGDFVDKGQAEAYEYVLAYFEGLERSFKEFDSTLQYLPPVVVPGNHDNVRPTDREQVFALERAREALLKGGDQVYPESVETSICLKPQTDFRNFESRLTGRPEPLAESRLAAIHEYTIGSHVLQVMAINTSWMCAGDQDQSALLAWTPPLPAQGADRRLRVVAMHHPSAWMHRGNGKSVERAIQGYADLVLSGHEHESDQFVRHGVGGAENAHFEGDALAGPKGGFAGIAVDLEVQQRKTYTFTWTGERYEVVSERSWIPLRHGVGAAPDGFQLTAEFESLLEDPGIATESNQVKLEDIFVYPRLREVNFEGGPQSGTSRTVIPEKVSRSADPAIPKPSQTHEGSPDPIVGALEAIKQLQSSKRLVLVGEARSGKSALLRKYFTDLRNMGLVPLLLKPDDCLSESPDELHAAVKIRAKEQYGDDNGQRFMQLPLSKRVILVDELHSINLTSHRLRSLLQGIAGLAEFSILAGDELYLLRQVWAAFNETNLLDYKVYKILELDPRQRREFAAKMQAMLGDAKDDAEFETTLSQLEKSLTAVLGDRIVTPLASEVKTILREFIQSAGGGTYGAYGFYYDSQIKRDIQVGIKCCPKEVLEPQADAIEAFLSRLAELLHCKGDYHATEADIDSIIEHFRDQKIPLEKSGIKLVLIRSRILVHREDNYFFRERYQRYYFMALRLSKMLVDESTLDKARKILGDLVESIHDKESADVVLFTIYLTNNPWLLSLLAERANSIFADEPECDMERDFLFAQESEKEVVNQGNLVPSADATFDPAREEALDNLLTETIKTMSEGFNILGILGLAVRNYPARIEVGLRERIIENGYALSLRSLSAFISLIKEGATELDLLAARHLKVQSRGMIASQLVSLCSFGIVRRAVQAFGSPHLEMVLNDVWKNDSRVSAKMIRFGVLLDLRKTGASEAGSFYTLLKNNPNGKVVLMHLVANHLQSFRASRERRVPLCNAVKLDPDNRAFFYDREKPRAIGRN